MLLLAARRGVALVHVAVTALRADVFHARLFFGGGSEGGGAGLQCDSRASDGLWLALATGAPVLMHKAVWATCSLPLRAVLANTVLHAAAQGGVEAAERVTAAAVSLRGWR